MDSLDAMRLFTRVVERRSFSDAAADLGLPRSTASEAVQQLEQRLGVRLLQRTTRRVSPTSDGEAYYRRCLSIIAEIEDAESAFTGAKPHGLLRIDVFGTLARHFLLPGLPRFFEEYPDMRIHIGEGDRLVDLVEEGVDCVIRSGEPRDSAMVGRRIAMLKEVTCASPGYLSTFGTPQSLDCLDGHRMIGFISSVTRNVIPLEFTVDGALRKVTLPMTVSVNAGETSFELAKLGFGLLQVPRYHIEPALVSGELVEVLPAFSPSPMPVSLLYPHSRQLSPRVRVFADWVTKEFATRVPSAAA
ncbi:MAG TPA: LysR family transcriptional regulator [Pseudolabrys sp.]|jgi:DNA-binding transcriptional LysR family regulator